MFKICLRKINFHLLYDIINNNIAIFKSILKYKPRSVVKSDKIWLNQLKYLFYSTKEYQNKASKVT